MDLQPLHPKLVHLPIALAILMPLVAGGLLLAWRRGALPRRTWILAVVAQGLLVVSGVIASRTGERDEERVEAVVAEAAIEAHEEAAETFVFGSAAVLALAVLGALIPRERAAQLVAAAATAGTLAVLFLGYRTGQAGGDLVYRHGAASAWTAPEAAGAIPASAYEHDNDD